MRVALYPTVEAEGRVSAEVVGESLAAALDALGEPGLVLDRRTPPMVGSASRRKIWIGRYGRYQWRTWRGQRDADVHHILDHGYGHLGLCLPRERTVITFHDAMLLRWAAGELPGAHYSRLTLAAHRVDLYAIERMAAVIAVSASARDDLLRFTKTDPARVHVVHHGVSPRFAPVPEARRIEGPIRILHVGHTGTYKNIEGILRALPLARTRLGADVRLVKAGGRLTPEQRQLAVDLGVAGWVEETGFIADAELPDMYRSADVLVMPSWNEGFGLPALEAMAGGIPVVVSDRGSLPEVVGDAGVIVNPAGPEAIADRSKSVV